MRRCIVVLCISILLLVPLFLVVPSVAVRPKVLVLYGWYYNWFSDVPYDVFRSLLSSYADIEYFYVPNLPEFLRRYDVSSWLSLRGYRLAVFTGCRSPYFDEVYRFLSLCLERNCSILFLPVDYLDMSSLFAMFGINLVRASFPVTNTSTNLVADDVVTRGVFVVGVRDWSISHYWVLSGSGLRGVVFSNGSWWGSGYALVFAGTINGGRVAGVVPYLYADASYDNLALFDNIVRWLLGLPVERGDGGSAVFKDLEEARIKLLAELERLRAERDRLVNEVLPDLEDMLLALNDTLYRLELANVTLAKLSELESRLANVEALVNSSSAVSSEVEVLRAEIRRAYFVAGLCGAVGIISGYALALYFERRRLRGGG